MRKASVLKKRQKISEPGMKFLFNTAIILNFPSFPPIGCVNQLFNGKFILESV